MPLPESARQVTIGWLLDGVASGRVPHPGPIDDATEAQAMFRLSIYQSDVPRGRSNGSLVPRPVDRTLAKGQSIGIEGAGKIRVGDLTNADHRAAILYAPAKGRTLTAVAGPLTVRLASMNPFFPVSVCE